MSGTVNKTIFTTVKLDSGLYLRSETAPGYVFHLPSMLEPRTKTRTIDPRHVTVMPEFFPNQFLGVFRAATPYMRSHVNTLECKV